MQVTEFSVQNNFIFYRPIGAVFFLACLHKFKLNGGMKMTKINVKKTLNLHKYSLRVSSLISDWKFLLPIAFSLAGLAVGACVAKGEGDMYKFFSNYINQFLIENSTLPPISTFVIYLLIPTVFAVILFFCGLSIYGGLISNAIPFFYSLIIGTVTYYLYNNYTLKGLAYCVIIIFPYAVLSLFSLILITGECINMSQLLTKNLNKNPRSSDYSFTFYYKNCLKSYVFIILATIVKTVLDSLFISLFSF